MPQTVLSFPEKVELRVGYGSLLSEQMDIAYQRLQSGWIANSNDQRNHSQDQKITSVKDNYIFINRYFSKAQVLWVFFMRILAFHNPLLEIMGLLSSLKFNRVKVVPEVHKDFLPFQSSLIESNPLVSLIIPTLNRYEYLKDVLADLEKQDYTHFEVIVCDQSEPINEAFYDGWNLKIQLIQQEEKALWLARNRCINQSKGDYILLFDDDSRVEQDWISKHLKCLDFFQVPISAGITHTLVGHGLGNKDTYFHLSDVFDTGNSLVHKDVFKKIGLFDRQFEKMRMGDGEFGLRAILGGYLVVSNPFALRIHLKVETGGLRQMGSWDALRPKSLFAPRPVPSVLYLARKYFGNESSVFYLIKNIPFSFIPYQFKKSKILKVLFVFLLPLLFPLMVVVVMKSWRKSSEMLKIGDEIGELEV